MSTDDGKDNVDGGRTWVELPSTAPASFRLPQQRYADRGLLGIGGMSEVRRVSDTRLERTVAVKTLLPEDRDKPAARSRFLHEARISASLQHPGVVPVHDLGIEDDGTIWFSMPVVDGQTLDEVLTALHAGDPIWPLRRVVDVIYQITQVLAFAHHEGLVHRDVKPANVMIGRFGEVRLLDWGIAVKANSDPDTAHRYAATGTPSYMAPEQAAGAAPTGAVDVYAVGAVLYQALTGSPAFQGERTTVLNRLRDEAPAPVNTRLVGADGKLVQICGWAMTREATVRPSSQELSDALRDWMDGAHAREQALEFVDLYHQNRRSAARSQSRAKTARGRAESLLSQLPEWAPELEKAAAWSFEDRAATHEAEASAERLKAEGNLLAAFSLFPHLPEAHDALAVQYAEAHVKAEEVGDGPAAREVEQRLRLQLDQLPGDHPRRRTLGHYLKGDGRLSLSADRPGVTATLIPLYEELRRLHPDEPEPLGPLPITAFVLPMGSYIVVLSADGVPDVRYPVFIERQGHWQGSNIHIPAVDAIHETACYVPAGPFMCGGVPEADNSLPANTALVAGFAMDRFPVTNAEFIVFLDDLVATGEAERALALAPRERAGTAGQAGALIYRYEAGKFYLQPDVDGDLWEPDWPVVNIAADSAVAYAVWLSARTGRTWRLPTEFEWEKAARGVDGRLYPWGNHVDASWCSCKASHQSSMLAASVQDFAVDVSVYGVRGMAGNTRDLTSTRYVVSTAPQDRVLLIERGGTWLTPTNKLQLCTRSWAPETHRFTLLGFRLAHDL